MTPAASASLPDPPVDPRPAAGAGDLLEDPERPPAPPAAAPPDLFDPAAGWSPARVAYLSAWWPHFGERHLAAWLGVPRGAIRAQVAALGLTRPPKAARLCVRCRARGQSVHLRAAWCVRCHRAATADSRARRAGLPPVPRRAAPLLRWMGRLLHDLQRRARRAGWPCTLTVATLWTQWQIQGGRCAYSGVPLRLPPGGCVWNPWGPSVDRVDPPHGYVVGNVVWAARVCNTGKSTLPAPVYETLCAAVVWQAARAGGRFVPPLAGEVGRGGDL